MGFDRLLLKNWRPPFGVHEKTAKTLQLGVRHHLGKAVQVDPTKPTLKAPGTKRLNLHYDKPLSTFPFKFNWRHHIWGTAGYIAVLKYLSPVVGRCRLTL